MGKVIKIILSAVSAGILALIILPVTFSLLLSIPAIQDMAGRTAASWLGKKLETTVTVDGLRLKLFNKVTLNGLYIEDYHGDTLFYAREIVVPVKNFGLRGEGLKLGNVELDRPVFYLRQDTSGMSNLRQLTSRLSSGKKTDKTGRKPFRLTATGCRIDSMKFEHTKLEPRTKMHGTDFNDISVSGFCLNSSNVSVVGDSFSVNVERIALREKGGFEISDFSAHSVIVSGEGIRLKKIKIDTPESHLDMNYFSMITGTWQGYRDFLRNVRFEADAVNSTVSFHTISYFAEGLKDWGSVLNDVSFTMEGPVADMQGHLLNASTLDTDIAADFKIKGLPDIRSTRFGFDVKTLRTALPDIEYILNDITGKPLGKISEWIGRMGNIDFTGNFDGLLSAFKATGKLATAQGAVDIDLSTSQGRNKNTSFSGRLSLSDYDLGNMLRYDDLGRISLRADMKGSLGDTFMVDAEADIQAASFKDYTYRDIAVNGIFDSKEFTGLINSADPNLAFGFDGKVSFNDSLPSYNFALDLQNCDLARLGFNKRDSVSVIKGTLKAEGSGTKLDDINGKASIGEMTYFNGTDTVRTGKIDFVADNDPRHKMLGMYSAFADVEFRGRLSYENMFSYLRNTLASYLPSISPAQNATEAPASAGMAEIDDYYLLSANIKEANNVAGIFVPQLELAEGTKLYFMFNPRSDLFAFTLESEYIQQGDKFFVSNLNINSRNHADSISLYLRADDLFAGGFYTPNFSVQGGIKNNTINLATRFDNPERNTSALLSTRSVLEADTLGGAPRLRIGIYPSYIKSGDQTWSIAAKDIVYQTNRIEVDDFTIASNGQSLTVSGTASDSREDTLRLRLDNFDLTPISQITSRNSYALSGFTNGYADIASALKDGLMYANIRFDSIELNKIKLPNTVFESSWDFQLEQAGFRLAEQGTDETVLYGYFRPTDRFLWARLSVDTLDLSLIDPLLPGILRGTSGTASTKNLTVTNYDGRLRVGGNLKVSDLGTTVDYTNVRYTMPEADIFVDSLTNVMTLGPANIYDPRGNPSEMSVRFDFSNFKNLGYEVNVRPDNIQVLGTTIQQNNMFYGDVYASGSVSIKGDKSGTVMDITAETTGQSQFFLPLGDDNTVSRADFIVFESPKKAAEDSMSAASRRREMLLRRKRAKEKTDSRLDISLKLDIRPNTEVQLVIDPTTGDIIKGRGNGNLNLNVNPSNNDFTIYGNYDITEGSYNVTVLNFISRAFTIEPGSNIRWTGDPADATLNVVGAYKLKASLAPLLGDDNQNYTRATPVECILMLRDRLSDPEITFDINLPNATPEIQSRVAHAINSPEQMQTQILWLLANKSFAADNQSIDQNTLMGNIGIDFLSSQIGNIMSSDRFSFMPKYNVRNEVSSSEWGGSFYGEIIKDKLILDVDLLYDTGDNPGMNTRTANSLTGDATLSLLLDEAGDFRVKAFSRTIDRYDEYQGLQESGIGIFYRENFDDFKDLKQVLKNRFKRIGKKKKPVVTNRMNNPGDK